MKVKAYFITYKNNKELSNTITSFVYNGGKDCEINIVNNSPSIPVSIPDIPVKYRVIENNTRPDFSTGHLARNWNECLIDGFRDINNPDCDIVILSQNDVRYSKRFLEKLIKLHETYSFIQNGCGDSFHSYTVDAIKKVGLWDERFCNIGCQEGDYFVRQRLFNPNCTINDKRHWREFNPINDMITIPNPTGWDREEPSHVASIPYHGVSNKVFILKYSGASHMHWDEGWEYKLNHGQYIMYPYFEKDFAYNNPNYSTCYL